MAKIRHDPIALFILALGPMAGSLLYIFTPSVLALWAHYSHVHYGIEPCAASPYDSDCEKSLLIKNEIIPAVPQKWLQRPDIPIVGLLATFSFLLCAYSLYSYYVYPQTKTIHDFLATRLNAEDRDILDRAASNETIRLPGIPNEPLDIEYQVIKNSTPITTTLDRQELSTIIKENKPMAGTSLYQMYALQITPNTKAQTLLLEVYRKRLSERDPQRAFP